ncbi:uncharacterized protein BT62DRAFT_462277 [Guyanagaster necrorhizus]|uniref:F-box domain-containing protein n=1 Tax=Guyanagaster necrorhizus TaxID=856835 RepID=A0A9P7VKE7_9AGAR|nr:uncharacterized protein BT62DRAFT_462277 [Guyanagaster necrorhizus MCA 3950]KAG7441975.1 hypothetical protein BT62DRAFT_462277 [Guyanagaster necrorhizus MCA 3950]
MLSACPTCGFLDLSNQKSDHATLNIMPNQPVAPSSADHQTDIHRFGERHYGPLISKSAVCVHVLPTSIENGRGRNLSWNIEGSAMSPIWSLPAEIIAEIITLAADDDNSDGLDTRHGMPWVLNHVCRLWRNVALSTAATWSRVYIDDTTRGRHDPFATQLLQTYLARSKEIPLSVSIILLTISMTSSNALLPTTFDCIL